MLRAAKLSEFALNAEKPVFYGDDVFGFNRSNAALPADRILDKGGYWFFGNVTVDYATPLACGLSGIAERVRALYPSADAVRVSFTTRCFAYSARAKSLSDVTATPRAQAAATAFTPRFRACQCWGPGIITRLL